MSENNPKYELNEDSDSSFIKDEVNEDPELYEYLKYNLLKKNINSSSENNNSYKMAQAIKTNKSSKISNLTDDEYYERFEEINEVKYNVYMMMNNNCRIGEEYCSFVDKYNNFALKRLVVQNFKIENNIL